MGLDEPKNLHATCRLPLYKGSNAKEGYTLNYPTAEDEEE